MLLENLMELLLLTYLKLLTILIPPRIKIWLSLNLKFTNFMRGLKFYKLKLLIGSIEGDATLSDVIFSDHFSK